MVRWRWLAPFGRVGHALRFRWVYPFGTLPLPFHPLFVPGVLVAATCWAGWKVVSLVAGDASDAWGPALRLVAAAGVVGIGLSVPVVSWLVLVLGGRIIQAVLVLAAMVLLAVGAATGRDAPWAAVPPAVFVVAWAVAMVRGRVARARLEAAARDFDPVAGHGRSVVLTGQLDARTVTALLERAGARAVWTQTHASRDATMHLRITHETAAAVRERAQGTLPDGVALRDREDHLVLELASTPPREAVWVEAQADRSAEHLGGPLHLVTVGDTSGARTVVTGMASVVLPIPLAQCFHWVSLTGPNEWCVGFARGRARRIGPGIENLHELFRPGVPVAPLGSSTLDCLLAPLEDLLAARDAAVAGLRGAALSVPFDSRAHSAAVDALWKDPHLLGDDAPAYLAGWMRRARDGTQPGLPATIARLVMRLSDDDIVSHGADFVGAFNSRKLALQWTLTPDLDRAPLPRDLYRFGDKAGFGLLLTHPELYVRLGDLLPDYRRLVSAVAEEMTVPGLVDEALTRWAAEG